MFWCSLVGANRPLQEAMPVAIACLEQEDLGCLLGAESDSCGEDSRWKGLTSRQVRVHFGKSGYSSGEKETWQGVPRRFSDTAG